MMEHSESIAKLAPALVAAVAEVENATKNATNPHFKSKYADLAEIINTVKPVFASHGLAVVQLPGLDDGHATVETMLVHTSGEWIKGVSGSPLQKNDPQGVGSAITYLRRYSLAALAGIAQEDDDGNAASGTSSSREAPARNGSSPARSSAVEDDMIPCPACGGEMWDNRQGKTNPKSPDLKCKDKGCDHAIWLKSWRDELVKEIAGAHASGTLDAKQRADADELVAKMNPKTMAKMQGRLEELAEAIHA